MVVAWGEATPARRASSPLLGALPLGAHDSGPSPWTGADTISEVAPSPDDFGHLSRGEEDQVGGEREGCLW